MSMRRPLVIDFDTRIGRFDRFFAFLDTESPLKNYRNFPDYLVLFIASLGREIDKGVSDLIIGKAEANLPVLSVSKHG